MILALLLAVPLAAFAISAASQRRAVGEAANVAGATLTFLLAAGVASQVLRSGALFVPQSEVHVVRPHDGTILGRVPDDIIPDLLRVGERCDVYVAEESGHLGAYEAGPRLTLVTPV